MQAQTRCRCVRFIEALLESAVDALALKLLCITFAVGAVELTWVIYLFIPSGSHQRHFGRPYTFIHDQGSGTNGRQNYQ